MGKLNLCFLLAASAALIIPALHVSGQGFSYDLRIEGLNGRVKRVDEDKAEIEFENGVAKEKRRMRHRTMVFDKKGRKTYEWIKISKMDPFEHFYSYKNDKRFRRTVRPGTQLGLNPTESFSYTILSFDKENNTLREKVFPGHEHEKQRQTQGYVFRFDESGCLIETMMLSNADKPFLKKDYIYTTGCLLDEIRIGPLSTNGTTQSIKYTYEIGENGNWKKQTIMNTFADANATTKHEVIYRSIEYYR